MRYNPFSILRYIKPLTLSFRLTWRLFKDRRVPFRLKLIPIGALLYFASPIDILSDFLIPVFGYADDIVILFFTLNLFIRLCPAEVVAEHTIILRGDSGSF